MYNTIRLTSPMQANYEAQQPGGTESHVSKKRQPDTIRYNDAYSAEHPCFSSTLRMIFKVPEGFRSDRNTLGRLPSMWHHRNVSPSSSYITSAFVTFPSGHVAIISICLGDFNASSFNVE